MKRKVVKILEDRCNGCGECIPSCAEGALEIVDGKARLVRDVLCDGLGDCLGNCPQDAIVIEEREAEVFDEAAVEERLKGLREKAALPPDVRDTPPPPPSGCLGSRPRRLRPAPPPVAAGAGPAASRLGQWPVQIHLLPVEGPLWHDKDVLIAADCVPFAMPDFHDRLLAGRAVAVGCPKLDDLQTYARKLTEVFRRNTIRSVTVAYMEVPCCHGLMAATRQALEAAGKADLPFHDARIGVGGELQGDVPPIMAPAG